MSSFSDNEYSILSWIAGTAQMAISAFVGHYRYGGDSGWILSLEITEPGDWCMS